MYKHHTKHHYEKQGLRDNRFIPMGLRDEMSAHRAAHPIFGIPENGKRLMGGRRKEVRTNEVEDDLFSY